jgi:hypothetical protein
MSTLTTYANMTLAEAMKRAGYDSPANVIGELMKQHDFMAACPWMPASDGIFHKYLQATRLGTGTFGSANAPVGKISSTTDEAIEPIKMFEGDSPIDRRIIDTAKDPVKVRDSEDALNLEGFLQGWEYELMYCNDTATPTGLKGLAQRRASLNNYCVGGSGTGSDLTSLWLFEFGPTGFNLRYSDQGVPGVRNEDLGLHSIAAPTGTGNYWAYIRHYQILAAMELRDQRAMLRYCNIETAGTTNTFSATDFIKLKNKLPKSGRDAVAFVNRTLKGQIEAAAYDKSNMAYSLADIEGFGPVPRVAAVPILMWESIINTETALTA